MFRNQTRFDVIVTRHPALIAYIRELGLIPREGATWPDGSPVVRIIDHATPDDLSGRRVLGVMPLHLAAVCESVTEIPLDLAPEQRGRELTLDEVRACARAPVTYTVEIIG
jgi:hypothetical protein